VILQDGAPAHSSRIRNHLNLKFPDKWIGRYGPIAWCPRSSDLTSLEFFLKIFEKYCVQKCLQQGKIGLNALPLLVGIFQKMFFYLPLTVFVESNYVSTTMDVYSNI